MSNKHIKLHTGENRNILVMNTRNIHGCTKVKFLENDKKMYVDRFLILDTCTYIFHEYILSSITEIFLRVALNTINYFKRCKMITGQLKTVWILISIIVLLQVCVGFSHHSQRKAMILKFYLYIPH